MWFGYFEKCELYFTKVILILTVCVLSWQTFEVEQKNIILSIFLNNIEFNNIVPIIDKNLDLTYMWFTAHINYELANDLAKKNIWVLNRNQRVYKSFIFNLEIYFSNKLFLSPNLTEPKNLFRNQFDFIDIKLPVS